MHRKGMSPIFEAIFLVVIAVSMSTLVAGWLSSLSTTQTSYIQNSTQTQLQCQFGNIFIKSASYNCNNNCATGTAHTTTLIVSNSGRATLSINNIYVQNTTGSVFALGINNTSLAPSTTVTVTNVSTATCNGINNTVAKVIINSLECPGNAYDSLDGGDITFTNC